MRRLLCYIALGALTAIGFVQGLSVTGHTLVVQEGARLVAYTPYLDGSQAVYYTWNGWLIVGVLAGMALLGLASYELTLRVLMHTDKHAGRTPTTISFSQLIALAFVEMRRAKKPSGIAMQTPVTAS